MSCISQNCRLFLVSNLSVPNFRIFLLMYTGSLSSRSVPNGVSSLIHLKDAETKDHAVGTAQRSAEQ